METIFDSRCSNEGRSIYRHHHFFNISFCLFFITIAFAGIGFLLPAVNYGITSAADESDGGFIVSLYGATRFLGVALGPIIFGWVPFNQTIFGFSLIYPFCPSYSF
ncbi:hypothetical protein [Aeribacillus pallidus]|uniref:hypothetical protein n=1 Tax=Aeribacillus pallidus TaxID=33936 RepID=UPI003D2260B2